MPSPLRLVTVLFLTVWSAGARGWQGGAPIVSSPTPAPIVKRGLTVQVRDLVRLPDTRGMRPLDQDVTPAGWARINFVRDLPDGRRFVNDSRGILYLLDGGNRPTVYANVATTFPLAIYNRLESGFVGFTFHPEFQRNGLFYTVHAERAPGNPATPNFIPPGFSPSDVTYHNIITEWHATNPAAGTFDGTRRELLRVGHIVANLTHPYGDLEFNPASKPGDPDYGLLYTSGSDLGFSNGGGPHANNPGQTQRLDTVIGAILRFDPRAPTASKGTKGLGDYTIPAVNRFAADNDAKTLGEIYAYGFRNAHRLSWDPTDGTMFAADIGMNNIEEINIVHEGRNYGWMKREGLFENGITRPGGKLDQLFPLSAEILRGQTKDEFTYPVAMYRPHAGPGRHWRVRLSRPHSHAPRQVRLWRHRPGSAVRGGSRGHQEGGRWHPRDGRACRRNPVVRQGLGRRPDVCDVPGARRGRQRHDGDARRPASQSHARRRAAADVAAGRDDSDAGARLIERL